MTIPFLAKPKGITLPIHEANVVLESKAIIAHHPVTVKKYQELTSFDLARRLNGASIYHDRGKQNEMWSKACYEDYLTFLKTGIVGDQLKNSGVRHEIESLKMFEEKEFSDPVKVAIAAHHAKLSYKFKDRWFKIKGNPDSKGEKLWRSFVKLSDNLSLQRNFERTVLKTYEFAGVRAYLQLGDHRASIKEEYNQVPEFEKFNYKFNPEWNKRKVQELVEIHWEDELLLLRAPTGSGKTEASLLWAKKQIESGRAERLVIAMPTRFTSNALSINIGDSILSESGLYHSSAWFTKFHEKVKKDPGKEHFSKLEHEFARLLQTPVTVCTIDHLLIAQTHSREDHHSISFNLANSCLVIDEADFYDEFTQANILQLLKILKILKVPVLLMSASLPESSLDFYKKTGYEVDKIVEDISDNQRIRCKVVGKTHFSNLSEIENVLERALTQPTIIYANTVARAMELYEWFTKREVANVVLYHSRFTEPDKLKKEKLLLDNLGRKAWENGVAKGIAILTQIGEMSVNISARLMISELCPIDRLVQRVGRLCRFDELVGELELLIPQKDDKMYPAPYGTYDRKNGWKANKAFLETEKLIEVESYNAFRFVGLVNQVYERIEAFSDSTNINQENYLNAIFSNWLIVPMQEVKEDETDSNNWKSRNIAGQSEVFTIHPDSYIQNNGQSKIYENGTYFNNYKEFQFYKNQYSLNYPNYLIAKAKEEHKFFECRVWIGVEKEPKRIWVCQSPYYSDEKGLTVYADNDSQL